MGDVVASEPTGSVVYTVLDSRHPDLEAASSVIGDYAEQVAHGGGDLVMILTERRIWTDGVPALTRAGGHGRHGDVGDRGEGR